MKKRKTAGELSIKAASDKAKYDPLEIGYALTDDVVEQLHICAANHDPIFDEDEYFICLFVASDPLIKNLRRHKYAAFLHLPSPRPNQTCFLYNKKTQKMKRLWSLPNALAMATISETNNVSPEWQKTKGWCDAFFAKCFWEYIRKENGISHLSEHEYLNVNREKFIKAGCQETKSSVAEPFDFSKVTVNQVVNTDAPLAE